VQSVMGEDEDGKAARTCHGRPEGQLSIRCEPERQRQRSGSAAARLALTPPQRTQAAAQHAALVLHPAKASRLALRRRCASAATPLLNAAAPRLWPQRRGSGGTPRLTRKCWPRLSALWHAAQRNLAASSGEDRRRQPECGVTKRCQRKALGLLLPAPSGRHGRTPQTRLLLTQSAP
jgi:hypothetical protein